MTLKDGSYSLIQVYSKVKASTSLATTTQVSEAAVATILAVRGCILEGSVKYWK